MEQNLNLENAGTNSESAVTTGGPLATCSHCGCTVEISQGACPNCGYPVSTAAPSAVPPRSPNGKKTGLIIGIAVAAAMAAAGLAIFLFLTVGNPGKYRKAQKLYDTGEYTQALELLEELGDYKDSENMAVDCKYNEGILLIQAKEYEKAERYFRELGEYKDSEKYLSCITWDKTVDELLSLSEDWLTVGNDRSYIYIDTNPEDTDKDDFGLLEYAVMSVALEKIEEINSALGFSEAVVKKMEQTTSMQGTQSDTAGMFSVSWTYHPDNGLEVTYEMKEF